MLSPSTTCMHLLTAVMRNAKYFHKIETLRHHILNACKLMIMPFEMRVTGKNSRAHIFYSSTSVGYWWRRPRLFHAYDILGSKAPINAALTLSVYTALPPPRPLRGATCRNLAPFRVGLTVSSIHHSAMRRRKAPGRRRNPIRRSTRPDSPRA